jgi:hypothetical protein
MIHYSLRRIAICISGLVRTYRETFQNFQDSILIPNQNSKIDVFISTWPIEQSNNSTERSRRLAWYGSSSPPFPENIIDYNDLKTKYNPVSMNIDTPIIFKTDWCPPNPGLNVQSLLSMVYKIYACDLLRRQYEEVMGFKYDAVIRTRFDCLAPRKFVIDDDFDLSVITAPSMEQPRMYPELDWLNDKFAIGNAEIMTMYSNWYQNFVPMILRGVPLQPETMLAAHLTEAGIRYVPFGTEMPLVRPAGF